MVASRRVLLSLLCAIMLATGVHARPQPGPEEAPVGFTHLTIEDGLSQQSVYAILQDHHGFMWFGTFEGLNKYDGYRFTQYQHDPNDPNSLSSGDPGRISALLEDRDGMIWIGYDGAGLSRFDPVTETFTHFRHDAADSTSLSSDEIRTLYEDRQGTLWVGARFGGLNRFEPETETFTKLVPDPEGPDPEGPIDASAVWAILEDASGILWVGQGQGLFRHDPSAGHVGAFTRFLLAPEAQTRLGANWVSALYEDRQGTLWVGGWGLHRFDRATGTFQRFLMDPDAAEPQGFGVNRVTSILEDHTGALWAGCTIRYTRDGGGLNRFDREKGTFTRYLHDPDEPRSLKSNDIRALYEDHQGILWVGTGLGGVSRVDRTTRRFMSYRFDSSKQNGLRGGIPDGLFLDRDDVLWIGTASGVLNRLDRRSDAVTLYQHDPADPYSLPAGSVLAIHRDRQGRLWVGTNQGGVGRLDETTGRFTRYVHDSEDSTSISSNEVIEIYEDRSGALWVGTFGGLNRLDAEKGIFTRYVYDPDDASGISFLFVRAIYEDHAGRLWFGGTGGLDRFDAEEETFTRYPLGSSDSTTLGAAVFGLYERPHDPGVLWIASFRGGLYGLDVETGRLTHHYTSQNSDLPNNTVWGILGDDEGCLWMSTHGGIVRFDPDYESFEVFGTEDGLQSLAFQGKAIHKGYDGELFFGTMSGIDVIRPGGVFNNPHPPEVTLTGLRLFNELVAPGPDSPLRTSITEVDSVVFMHDQNDLTIEYVGLHFRQPERNQYTYMLEGYDDTWRAVGTERRAVYTSLPPGEYVFRVKAANSDGVWNEQGRRLAVTILPPWWRTTWAYLLYGLLLAATLFAADRVQRRRLLRKERERAMQRELEQARQLEAANARLQAHEQQLERQNVQLAEQARRLAELDQLKSRFFANLSHEFRTPLTLILGPLQDALHGRYGTLPDRLRAQLALMRQSAHRLLELIGELLDLSKLEAGAMPLQAQPTDVVPLLRRLVRAFAARAEREGITLQFEAPPEDVTLYVDRDKLEKVVVNLLANAFKFTPSGGKVHVGVAVARQDAQEEVAITVRDTGQGIPAEERPYIFDRFYQVDASATRRHEGTGIGLALVKELVERHGGRVTVESTVGFGTTFTVHLPQGKAHLRPEDLAPEDTPEDTLATAEDHPAADLLTWDEEAEVVSGDVAEPIAEHDQKEDKERPVVLVVEDHADVRAYLHDHLAERYRVVEAGDGAAGLAQACRHRPDLVIADVMMPEMDGLALCQALKTDATLSHVPVILLTARAAEESKLEGLETGADDYLTKPFSTEELLARAENLIEIRRRLRQRFSEEVVIGPSQVTATSQEAAFLEQVRAVVEAGMGEPSFGVDRFAEEVGLSTRQLHRKLQELTDLTPGGYIRMMRLERAAQLLEQQAGNVSEVAYQVGFNDANYFSRLFKQAFGVTPSAFAAEAE